MSQVYSGLMLKILSTMKGVMYSFFLAIKSLMALVDTLSKGRAMVQAMLMACSFSS